jgi:4a-hydroxytetrahydrobiopterin dehydratase
MWKEENTTLVNEFAFPDFKSALAFVNEVGAIAERMNHHPVIALTWGKVKIVLTTHSEGKVTDKDYQLAEGIDAIKVENAKS